jgi:hypothetical protein
MKKIYKYFKNRFFTSSNEYWESRYLSGGNSGSGSYSDYASYKARFINEIIKKYNIKTVTELGCGDGNNLNLYKGFDKYYGYDISQTIINQNIKRFSNQKYSFKVINDDKLPCSDLCMSLDVIYHLVETVLYKKHILQLFGNKTKYVLIYSSNFRSLRSFHVRHRRFTNDVPNNYRLILKNNVGFNNSSARFFLFEKID